MLFLALLVFSISTKICNGEEPWTGDCRGATTGNNLSDDYDASVPPSKSTRVSLLTHIFDISEVDDFKHLVTVRFATSYGWRGSRVIFKRDSVYGRSLSGSILNSVFEIFLLFFNIFGKYVENHIFFLS